MTRYEQGFMDKCAEYGVDRHVAAALMKTSVAHQDVQTGAYSNTDKGENALYQKVQHNPPVFAKNLSFGQRLALWLNGDGWPLPYAAGSPYARGTGPQRF